MRASSNSGRGASPVATNLLSLDSQLRRLEQQQRQRAGSTSHADSYAFLLSPACPPSTSVRFQGGLAWFPAYATYPTGFYIPSYTVDLTDPDKVSVRLGRIAYTYTFTNADWYVPCVVVISQQLWPPPVPPDTWPDTVPDNALYLYGGVGSPYMEEFETAAEAEVALREIRGDVAGYYGIAAAGLVLRNNGNTTDSNQYQQVDQVNRGRSYLFGNKRYGWEMG